MEPNKLEQDFRQKLEQRTLQPTEMAWDRLDAMLTVAEGGQKKKPNRTWMYMAASFLALLLVGALFLSRENQEANKGTTINNSVVGSDKKAGHEQPAKATEITTNTANQQEAVAAAAPVNKAALGNAVSAKPVMAASHKNTLVATATVKDHNTPANNEAVANTALAMETPSKLQPAKIKVDANELLATVDTPALNNSKAGKPASVKVNANSLLSSVEGELNESFRDRVLQTVSKNFDKVKTSVASRNIK